MNDYVTEQQTLMMLYIYSVNDCCLILKQLKLDENKKKISNFFLSQKDQLRR